MFDENQIIETKWTNHNREWYKERGYTYTNINCILFVKAKDLPLHSKELVTITCECCGKVFERSYALYQKSKNKELCSVCAHRKTTKKKMELHAEDAICKAKEMCDKLGYKLITTIEEYNGMSKKISYECPKHGLQTSILRNLLNGHGCNKCGVEATANKCRLSKEELIRRVESVNENKLLNPEEYIDMHSKNMKIKCKCGNIFITSIHNYRTVNVCQECSKSESKGERRIRQFLEDNGIEFIQEKQFSGCRDKFELRFDFYLPIYNTCIEYDGEQHYWGVFSESSTELTKKHDIMKNNFCAENNITLIRIPYFKKKQINEILSNIIQVKDIV